MAEKYIPLDDRLRASLLRLTPTIKGLHTKKRQPPDCDDQIMAFGLKPKIKRRRKK